MSRITSVALTIAASVCLGAQAAVMAAPQAVGQAKQELPVQRLSGERALTPADEAELARLVAPHGRGWLILEPQQGQVAGNWHSSVYLQPSEASGSIRRGKIVFLTATAVEGRKDLQNWNATTHNYVQVPLTRTGTLTRDSQEFPFSEYQRLPDSDLLSLVAIVRKCPCQPESGAVADSLLSGNRPIRYVRVGRNGRIEVYVERERWSGWLLEFQRGASTWRLIAISFVIA